MVINKNLKFLIKYRKDLYGIISYRWMFLIFAVAIYVFSSPLTAARSAFLITLVFIVGYNFFATFYILKTDEDDKGFLLTFIVYMDIIIASVLSYETGGLDSDIYILLLGILIYYGVRNNLTRNVNMCFAGIIGYAISSISLASGNMEGFNYWTLIIRSAIIIFVTCGVPILISEVKKYDEIRRNEFKAARTDKLTGLPDKRYLEHKLNSELEYVNSSGKPLNVLIFNLDNFRRFNENYGRIWGDKLLAVFADIIKQNSRKSDVPIRYGGEEFLILIRDQDMSVAKNVGDRIRKQLEKQGLTIENEEDKISVTVSCGIAQYPKHSKDIDKVFEYASKSLLRAKQTGKNRVVCFDEIDK